MTDVLGVCESWPDPADGSGAAVVLRREKGDVVEIPLRDVVAGKPVPPRPSRHRRLGAEDADRLAAPGWPAVETEPLGDWLLRAASGFTKRANSVLALGDPPEDAVRRVERWYAARSLPAQAHVHPGSPADLLLRDAGWEVVEQTLLLLASPATVRRRLRPPVVELRVDQHPDAAWLATDERSAAQPEAARTVLERGGDQQGVWFATAREHGRVVARGRGVVHGDWLGLASLWTHPDRRGRGLGRAVVGELLARGAERGATTVYLQVVRSNRAALGLYERLGFEEHHRYDYLRG